VAGQWFRGDAGQSSGCSHDPTLLEDMRFELRLRAVPRAPWLTIGELGAVQTKPLRSMYPAPHGTRVDFELGCYPMHALASPDQANHLTTLVLNAGSFFAMMSIKKPKTYRKALRER
jgi:hypothetical protein